ncbi:glycosyltransferase family protein [Solwaraspora sp. WMMD792]|uniref:glycosyltransferase family protein n=1 Tax=Solwaraspora sp. WMMD792 TaxID=3016099 RepID=UPI002417C52D|nr:glycosyltransferase family protein [Solwaraspora sp. WMMD792]MDG4774256.1 glycosyltransferase family protein [Solwaraspora sp. WMMD792]
MTDAGRPAQAPAAPTRRVLVGACGMGNGHASRQLNLVRQLQERGHRVALVTFGDGVAALNDAFPSHVPIAEPTHFPGGWVAMTPTGIDITRSAANGRELDPRGDAWNFALCEQVAEQLGDAPEVVLTDYEPASAQIAYLVGARLITTEQQSKFLLYRTPDAGGYTRWHEAAKLRYFFPAADDRIASSFFPLEWERDERYEGQVIEPILRPDVLSMTPEVDGTSVVVYLSPYAAMRQEPAEFLRVLAGFPEVTFTVFSKTPIGDAPQNVVTSLFDRPKFTEALRTCSAVVATAGHQLLSECLYLRKPVLALPFDVYEQQFNAMMLDHCGIGVHGGRELSADQLRRFLDQRPAFAQAADRLATRQFTGSSADLLNRLGL